ncbi:hypothetical protein WN944_023312 [Citrus x changshan-huyou]|uniref:Protein kinase domain-containing protein n=1 Tax=Citrus x changshan-huyou TaxID=2935761 RepID=A0AAP0N4L2_9ROSI
MQTLTLRFGRRKLSDSAIAFIKVDATNSSSSEKPLSRGGKKAQREDIAIISCLFVTVIILILATFGIFIYRCRVQSYRIIPGGGSASYWEREFKTEMNAIGRTHHRNLVRLLGYSFDVSNKILVYDYMSNGSLVDVLFTPEKQPNWVERMGIARDIARGIRYLHDECEAQIIHCDIKPQNILMDKKRCAKISDFGLAKLMKPDQTRTFTGIRGTRAYVAAEWHRNLPITVKADVYSFEVVLLEIICLRRCLDQNRLEDRAILQEWIYQCFENGNLSQLVEDEEVDQKQLQRMIKVGLRCILDEPSLRRSMKKVLLMLEGTVEIPIPQNPTSFLSTI